MRLIFCVGFSSVKYRILLQVHYKYLDRIGMRIEPINISILFYYRLTL